MKHLNFKSFVLGVGTTALIAGLSVTALAATGALTIEVNPINVQVNGQTFAPKDAQGNSVPVFSYNGTTYAPLRALAEAYGLEVGYDQGKNMATVGEKGSDTAATTIIDVKADKSYTLYFFGLANAFDGVDVSKADLIIENGLVSVDNVSYIATSALKVVPQESKCFEILQSLQNDTHGKIMCNGQEYILYNTVYQATRSSLSLFSDSKELCVLSVIN